MWFRLSRDSPILLGSQGIRPIVNPTTHATPDYTWVRNLLTEGFSLKDPHSSLVYRKVGGLLSFADSEPLRVEVQCRMSRYGQALTGKWSSRSSEKLIEILARLGSEYERFDVVGPLQAMASYWI
jgi:hypothetical protein